MKDSSRAEQLFQQNIRLAYWTISRYYPALITDEDVKQEALIGLWKACKSYDEEKGTFATYAVTCIANAIRMVFRTRNRWSRVEAISLDEITSEDGELTLEGLFQDPAGGVEESGIFVEEFIRTLDDRSKKVVACRLQGLKQREAARVLGVSQSYYCRLLQGVQAKYRSFDNGSIGGKIAQ